VQHIRVNGSENETLPIYLYCIIIIIITFILTVSLFILSFEADLELVEACFFHLGRLFISFFPWFNIKD